MDNPFKELEPVAKQELLRVLTTSRDDKVVVTTARAILEASGGMESGKGSAPIMISNSQVVLLTATAKEMLEHGGKG